MLARAFGRKTDVVMKKEMLAKLACDNIVCVIHELYEAA